MRRATSRRAVDVPRLMRRYALAASGGVLHLALGSGALAGLPVVARVLLAFAVVVVWPGLAWVVAGARPPGGGLLGPAWALGFGVAWNAALVLLARMIGLPFTVLVGWGWLPAVALWAWALWRRPRAGAGADLGTPWPRAAVVAVALAAGLATWYAARFGAPMGFHTDSPDHVGTIRRMLEHGDAFPNDAFYRDAGAQGADPRKGLWHPQVAVIARLAGADPIDAWRLLPIALAPLIVLNGAAFGFLLRGVTGAAVTAWAMLLTYGGSIAGGALVQSVYGARLADLLALAAATAAIHDLVGPAPARRWAAVGLGLAAAAVHVWGAVQLAMALGSFGVALALRDRGLSARVRRLAGTAAAMGAAALPYLAWRASQAYAPRNVIHTEPQGLLWLTDRLSIVSPGVLWTWLGGFMVLFPLCWPALWRAGRNQPAALYLFASSLAVLLVAFNPLAVAVLQPFLGYLLMRMVWLAFLPGFLGWLLLELAARWRAGARPARLRAAAALSGVLVLCIAPVVDAITVLRHPARFGPEAGVSIEPWSQALRWMDRNLPAGSVVLSDPTTSYSIPMYTRHYVVTLVDQHSSPNDASALRRILDARDALDPHAGWERSRAVIGRYGVEVVALNDRFPTAPVQAYWAANPAWFAAARRRLDRHPAAFERVYDSGDFVVYRVHRQALDTLGGKPDPRPFVRRYRPGRDPVARRLGDRLPVLQNVRFTPRAAPAGATLAGVAEWRVLEPLPPASYQVSVRFDRELPGGLQPPPFLGKPVRKGIEALRGERYRFRADHPPVAGRYGVDLWRPGEVVVDSFTIRIPPDAAPGSYTVRIKPYRQPGYPNLRLSDYFFDQDFYAGVPVGRLQVGGAPPALPTRAAGVHGGS
jgi:hypothetical protein